MRAILQRCMLAAALLLSFAVVPVGFFARAIYNGLQAGIAWCDEVMR